MAEITETIDVGVPVHTAYNQWTQFEDFPQFMNGIEAVRQLDERTLRWTASVAGRRVEWDAVITDQTRDRRIAWRSLDGATNAGDVDFEPIDDTHSRVRLHLVYEPQGATEKVGSALGRVGKTVRDDLERFRDFVESRGGATGAWRGEIHQAAPDGTHNPERG